MLTWFYFFLKRTPFFRLLLPFTAGIILQYYCDFSNYKFSIATILFCGALIAIPTSTFKQYRLRYFKGVLINLVLICLGIVITYFNSENHKPSWFGKKYSSAELLIAKIEEPPVEKNKSFKAEATVIKVISKDSIFETSGKIIIYFGKDSSIKNISYGTTIRFRKELNPIQFSGNPGTFDYQRYSAFNGIYHQVFLKVGEYSIGKAHQVSILKNWLYQTRKNIVDVLQKYIPGAKEKGLAEALLIGYRDNLDKSLVQAYSNTGVVHIIAISGLHLGLIYGILLLLLRPLEKKKYLRWLKPVLVITILWAFSLLSGASSSVLRSAVMFTAITLGESLNKRASIYNSMAASAFLLLAYDPFYLWDAGFQLSYAAVLSIVVFFKTVNNWFYFSNKLLQKFWELNAVTISAQIFTIPLVIYHFHQFPTLFLFANLVAVPLSSIILLGEIVLCILAFTPFVAKALGEILNYLLMAMNGFIERIDKVSFSVIQGIQLGLFETILIYAALFCFTSWLMQKFKAACIAGFLFVLGFSFMHTILSIGARSQQKIIVYNVPGEQAMDFVKSNTYYFVGEETLFENDSIQNLYFGPTRTLYSIQSKSIIPQSDFDKHFFVFGRKVVVLVDDTIIIPREPVKADLVLLSRTPGIGLEKLANLFPNAIFVADASNSLWKIQQWKKEAEQLHLRFHSVSQQGAFILDANPGGNYTVKKD